LTKQYDKSYFDRWYRGRNRVHTEGEVRRKVTLAVVTAEYFLRAPLRSVLDVGCGEGAWFPHLRALRPKVHYLGLDPSDYAIAQFGRVRNLKRAGFEDVASLRLQKEFDLVICSDVLHYLDDREIRSGFPELVRLCGGVAYLEVLTAGDDITGDLQGLKRRPAAWYRRTFTNAGLRAVGPYLWLAPPLHESAAELELV
jgi:SAM-dependent methyltransferase